MLYSYIHCTLSCVIRSSDVVRMVCIFREAEDIHSRESSNTYINSLGSYFIDSNLLVDLSNTSIGSLDSNYSSDASMVRSFLAQNWCWSRPLTIPTNKSNCLAFVSALAENFIEPVLVRFLTNAYDLHDVKALRTRTQLLLEIVNNCTHGFFSSFSILFFWC